MCRQPLAMKELRRLHILKHQFRYEYVREKQEKTETQTKHSQWSAKYAAERNFSIAFNFS